MLHAVIPVTIFLVGDWKYRPGDCFSVFRGIFLARWSFVVLHLPFLRARYRQSHSSYYLGNWCFEFELSARQITALCLFDHRTSGTSGPKGPSPELKPKLSTHAGCLCLLLWCPKCRFCFGLVRMSICLQRVE
jgi:hypothetical protein